MTYATTDLSDEFTDRVDVCAPILTSFGGRRTFHGPIATVKVYEDNVLVLEALESVEEGTVIVVDGGGSTNCALLGDRLAGIAVSRNLGGVIVNGCIRDSAEISGMDVAVLALAPHPRKSRKDGKGERDVPISFGGIEWVPGHHVYADEDGVIISAEPLV